MAAGSGGLFIGDNGYRALDIVRIPRNAVHWVWVRDNGGCVLFESHTLPPTGDEKMKKGALPLLGSVERRAKIKGVKN